MRYLTDAKLFIVLTLLSLTVTLTLTQWLEFRTVNAFIAQHVVLGSIAFIIGGFALLSKKGGLIHRASGQLFYTLMTVSSVLTLVVSVMPYHVSYSMFQISVMTLYFLIGGKRSLSFKKPNHNLIVDKLFACIVIAVSLVVMFHSVILDGVFYPLRTVFGAVAISFATCDLLLFSKTQSIKKYWLALHLSKITAGYTTAVTGFFVAQNIIGGYYNWFTPTAITLVFITYWLIKLKFITIQKKRSATSSSNVKQPSSIAQENY